MDLFVTKNLQTALPRCAALRAGVRATTASRLLSLVPPPPPPPPPDPPTPTTVTPEEAKAARHKKLVEMGREILRKEEEEEARERLDEERLLRCPSPPLEAPPTSSWDDVRAAVGDDEYIPPALVVINDGYLLGRIDQLVPLPFSCVVTSNAVVERLVAALRPLSLQRLRNAAGKLHKKDAIRRPGSLPMRVFLWQLCALARLPKMRALVPSEEVDAVERETHRDLKACATLNATTYGGSRAASAVGIIATAPGNDRVVELVFKVMQALVLLTARDLSLAWGESPAPVEGLAVPRGVGLRVFGTMTASDGVPERGHGVPTAQRQLVNSLRMSYAYAMPSGELAACTPATTLDNLEPLLDDDEDTRFSSVGDVKVVTNVSRVAMEEEGGAAKALLPPFETEVAKSHVSEQKFWGFLKAGCRQFIHPSADAAKYGGYPVEWYDFCERVAALYPDVVCTWLRLHPDILLREWKAAIAAANDK